MGTALFALVQGCTSEPADGSVADGVLAPACGTGALCLRTDIVPPGQAYEVAVVWFQLDDDGPDPDPEVVYQVTVPAGTPEVGIRTADVKPPSDERNLLCARATDDENLSPCLSATRVSYGVAVAYVDDGDGKFGGWKGPDKILGYGDAIFGYSATSFSKGANIPDASFWERQWPEGAKAGVHIYQLARPEGGPHDRPVSSVAGRVNALDARGPNLT